MGVANNNSDGAAGGILSRMDGIPWCGDGVCGGSSGQAEMEA